MSSTPFNLKDANELFILLPRMSSTPLNLEELDNDQVVYLPVIEKIKVWRKLHEDVEALMFADFFVAKCKAEKKIVYDLIWDDDGSCSRRLINLDDPNDLEFAKSKWEVYAANGYFCTPLTESDFEGDDGVMLVKDEGTEAARLMHVSPDSLQRWRSNSNDQQEQEQGGDRDPLKPRSAAPGNGEQDMWM
jgi:hypothetical protein